MNALAIVRDFRIAPMTFDQLEEAFSEHAAATLLPQVPIDVRQMLHAGVYSRTIMVPKGVRIVGALIKIPTQVTIAGDVDVKIAGEWQRVTGFAVLAASAGRKQEFKAHADSYIKMDFASHATTAEQAEEEFTDEAEFLTTRHGTGIVETIITGE